MSHKRGAARSTTRFPSAAFKIFLSPAFYKKTATEFGDMVATNYLKKGLMAQPIVGLMVTLCVTGYFVEYAVLGRYHVAHHKEEEAAALKEYRAKHAHH